MLKPEDQAFSVPPPPVCKENAMNFCFHPVVKRKWWAEKLLKLKVNLSDKSIIRNRDFNFSEAIEEIIFLMKEMAKKRVSEYKK